MLTRASTRRQAVEARLSGLGSSFLYQCKQRSSPYDADHGCGF